MRVLYETVKKETPLVKACLQALQLRGFVAWRQNSGLVVVGKGTPEQRAYRGAPTGTADILLVLPPRGRLCGIECKRGRNTLSPGQERWRDKMLELGARYGVARSVNEALHLAGIWAEAEKLVC